MIAGLQLTHPDKSQPVPSHVIDGIKHTLYHKLIGSLNYLAVATWPNIAYSVGHLACFLDCYCNEHRNTAICILCYIKGTQSLSLTLGGKSPLSLIGYADSDYANCHDTSRSISGYCFFSGWGMVSWSSKKQKHAMDSSCYTEYITLHHAGKELIFLCKLLEGLGMPSSAGTPLHCNNNSAQLLTEDHSHHTNVKYHTIHDLVEENLTHIACIWSFDNVTNIFIKSLACSDFKHFWHLLGLHFS
jgi:hypothetical protein